MACLPIWTWDLDGNGSFQTNCSDSAYSPMAVSGAVAYHAGWLPDMDSYVAPDFFRNGTWGDSPNCPSCGCSGGGGAVRYGPGGPGGSGGAGLGRGAGSGFGVYGPGFSFNLSFWLLVVILVIAAVSDRK